MYINGKIQQVVIHSLNRQGRALRGVDGGAVEIARFGVYRIAQGLEPLGVFAEGARLLNGCDLDAEALFHRAVTLVDGIPEIKEVMGW